MNNLAEKTIIFSDDILQDYVIIYNEKDFICTYFNWSFFF